MKRGSRTDEILTLAFMLLAIGAGVFYFAAAPNRLPFFCIGGAAVAVRITQYVLRCF